MAHPRKLLRHAAVALLAAAGTAAGTRVFSTRVDPFKKGAVPAISVYILHEDVDLDASALTAPRELKRDASMEIVGYVGGVDEDAVVDAIDDLCEQIEAAMDLDREIAGTAGDSILESTVIELREANGASDPLVGVVALTYSVTYRTSPAAPANLDDFRTVDAKHEVVGGIENDTVPAEDLFTVQEPPP